MPYATGSEAQPSLTLLHFRMNPTTISESLSDGLNRRNFLRRAITTGAGAALLPGALNSLSAAEPTAGLSTSAEQDYFILNFALMLEYLEGNFYSLAVHGQTLAERGFVIGGFGTKGNVLTKSSSSTKVPFTPGGFVEQYAMEIAKDESKHVAAIRATLLESGLEPAAQPELDLHNSFNMLGAAIGIGDFDPFASETNFLLGGFIFEDVGVTAYHGAAPLIANKTYLSAAAGILAVEGYHASLLRTKIFESGTEAQEIAGKISAARAALGSGKDQGVVLSGTANIVPTDANAIAFSRGVGQVQNIVFGKVKATKGLFFPNGMNLPTL